MFNVIFILGASILINIKVTILEIVLTVVLICPGIGIIIVVNIGTHHVLFPCGNVKRVSDSDLSGYCRTFRNG